MANIESQREEQRSREQGRSRQESQLARRGYDPFAVSTAELFNNPFSVMRRMHDEMDRVFSDVFGGGRVGVSGMGGGLAGWAPAIEVSERDNEMMLCAELPGLKPEDVKVEVTEDAVVIQGERKQEREEKQGGRWQTERRYGHFYRAIPLPEGAKAEQARAEFKNGELQVTIPVQRPESKRRQIPITGAK